LSIFYYKTWVFTLIPEEHEDVKVGTFFYIFQHEKIHQSKK